MSIAEEPPVQRRVVFVVGSGRSGTSTMAGALQTLGMHVPQPEVVADETNPKGFGEPQWVVDFHHELLKRCNVQVSDARPSAWYETGKLGTFGPLRMRLHDWLEPQFAEAPELVVKDPRLAWFVGLWRSAALRCDATPSYVTMLRPVTEVVGSKQRYYTTKFGEVQRTAAWVNMMLHTERATRGSQRAFVRYADMLRDWTIPVHRIGREFGIAAIEGATANDVRAVHDFIDPQLHRVQLTWDDIEVPTRLRDIAEETWQHLDKLADEGGDTPDIHDRLDELRTAYGEMYDEAEAIASSSALAAHRDGLAQKPAPGRAGAGHGRLAGGVRGMVPPKMRRGLRRALASMTEPDIRCLEGDPAYDVTWPWHDGKLRSGLTCVFRVKNEARNLPWVLPRMLEAVQHVVLVDNGSDDGTPEVAREIAERVRRRGPLHRHVVPLAGEPGRRRAPRHPARLRALADPLLQLVVRARAHGVLDEVGRRHGARPRGRRDARRPVLAAGGLRRGGRDPAAPAVDRERRGGLDRPGLPVPRAVGLPDGAGVHVREGLRVGGARVPGDVGADHRAGGPVRGAQVARQRRVRALVGRGGVRGARGSRASAASARSTAR